MSKYIVNVNDSAEYNLHWSISWFNTLVCLVRNHKTSCKVSSCLHSLALSWGGSRHEQQINNGDCFNCKTKHAVKNLLGLVGGKLYELKFTTVVLLFLQIHLFGKLTFGWPYNNSLINIKVNIYTMFNLFT